MPNWLKKFPRGKRPINDPDVVSWGQLPAGETMLWDVQSQLDHWLPQCFGYYALAMGSLTQSLDFSASPIRHWFHVADSQEHLVGVSNSRRSSLISDFTSLPVSSDSVDLVLLPHTLDFSENPHQVLREVERVLIPDGHLIVVGYNPFSWWGGRRLLRRDRDAVLRAAQFISPGRLEDWFRLMGLEFKEDDLHLIFSPFFKQKMDRHQWLLSLAKNDYWPALGAVYMMMAQKKVSTLTPIRPSWQYNKRLVPSRLAEPGVRRIVEQELNHNR